jgi:TolB-like protein/Flp pilus assembly protein TadD
MSPPESSSPLRFGDFELDSSAFQLRHLGQTVRLERRPMDLLILLAERRGQLVSRDDIVARLWGPDVFVDVETGVNTAIRKVRHALQDSPDSPLFIETVPGRGYRFIARVRDKASVMPQSSTETQPRIMLVVLPFENLSDDPEQEYFSDGLTEETISYLGRINPERMGVIARTTSMAYKRARKSIREIGAELNVDYALESSVRRENKQVRITVQLIRVKDQTHIWTATYDREVKSVLAIQNELGTAIADHVRLQLSPEQLQVGAIHQPATAEAFDLYLRGRYFWNQLSPPTTRRAIEYYTRATDLDPHYALAWSGLADAFTSSPISGDAPPLQVWPKAGDAARRAIEAAPNLAETQTSLGFVKFWLDWKWPAAESAFRKAVTLNPSYALAHRLLGIVQMHLRRHEDSLAAIKRARDLDPLNAGHHALSAQIAFAARDYDASVRFSRQAISIDPEFWIAYLQLGQSQEQLDKPELALEALTHASRLSGGNTKAISLRGYILAKEGKQSEARELLATLEVLSKQKYVPPYAFALVYAGLGQHEEALQFLDAAYDVHDVHLAFLPIDPKWDPFRRDSRFVDLLDRCGFLA